MFQCYEERGKKYNQRKNINNYYASLNTSTTFER